MGTLDRFEEKLAQLISPEKRRERLEATFETVGLAVAGGEYEGSVVERRYNKLLDSMRACHQGTQRARKAKERLQNIQKLLTIKVSKEGGERIEKEVKDVEDMVQHEYEHAN